MSRKISQFFFINIKYAGVRVRTLVTPLIHLKKVEFLVIRLLDHKKIKFNTLLNIFKLIYNKLLKIVTNFEFRYNFGYLIINIMQQ
jgi:hypothetical protein